MLTEVKIHRKCKYFTLFFFSVFRRGSVLKMCIPRYTLKRSYEWPPTFFVPVKKVNIALTKFNPIKKNSRLFRNSEKYAISKLLVDLAQMKSE